MAQIPDRLIQLLPLHASNPQTRPWGLQGASPSEQLSPPQGGMCSVYLKDSEKVVSISSEHLEPITPTKNNKVRNGDGVTGCKGVLGC